MKDFYRQAFEQVALGLVVTDRTGHIIEVNPHFCALLGRAAGDLLGKAFNEFTHPDDRSAGAQLQAERLDSGSGEPYAFDKRYLHADGSTVWAAVTVSEERCVDGRTASFVATVRDISSQRNLMNDLREKTWLLAKAQEMSNVGHWRLDALTSEVIGSEQLFRIFGIRDDEANLEAFASVVHPEDLEYDMFHIQRGLREGKSWDIEHRLLCRDGTVKYVRAAGEATLNVDGSVKHLFGTVADISEAHDVSRKLRASEEKLRTILDSTADALITIERDGTMVDTNRAASELFGYCSEEMVGQNVAMLMPAKEASRHDGYLRSYDSRRESSIVGSARSVVAVDKAGTSIPVTLRVGEASHRGRQVFIGTVQDNREQERMRSELLQAQKLESIGRLAGGVAHDFNNLLMVILSSVELLGHDTPDGTELRSTLTNIQEAAERGAGLTQQLLAFARVQVVVPKQVVANELIVGVEGILRTLLGEGIELELKLDANLERILMDPGQFDQLVMNLVANAKDAIRDTGHCRIETENRVLDKRPEDWAGAFVPGAFVRLAVSDDGSGMPPEVVSKIFEPFFSTKGPGEGTGLGLATCYGIVMQNGGGARVESQPGIGSTFCFFFPAVSTDSAPELPKVLASRRRGCGTVLLVEDDPKVGQIVQDMLTSLGYQVVLASNGEDALSEFERNGTHFNIVVSDVVMPRMGGPELVQRLKTTLPELRTLFMSGNTKALTDGGDLLPSGARCLQKPFTAAQLSLAMREILDGEVSG